jgi:NitT/TauT family transport system substrate-binding protein
VTDQNMADSVALLVEYGGVDASAAKDPKVFYSREFLPPSTN